jgi:hypothetical protein
MQGNHAEAEAICRETLVLCEKVLVKDHPYTLVSMNNLSFILGSQNKYAEGETMHQETLALREKILGKEHLETLISVYNLACCLQRQHLHKEALQLYHRAYTGLEDALGFDHPTTLGCLKHYISAQHAAYASVPEKDKHVDTDVVSDSVHSSPQCSST